MVDINLNDKNVIIGDRAFFNCTSLVKIYMSSFTSKNFNLSAFLGCDNLTAYVQNSYDEYGEYLDSAFESKM